jgi:arginyl-tRNA synthetase
LKFSLSFFVYLSICSLFHFSSISNIFSISDGRQTVDVKDQKVVLSKSDDSMLYKTRNSLSFFVSLSICLFLFSSISNIFSISDGRQAVDVKDRKVVLSKSDGSTLYITRDCAAAIDRHKMFDSDKVLYVVETGQAFHFENLFEILSKLEFEWSKGLRHVNFGRIEGIK